MCTFLVGGVLIVLLPFAVANAEDKQRDRSPGFWMKQKLSFAQAILNGLATEDYGRIQDNALAMQGLNKIESFIRQEPRGYAAQLQTFQFSVNELVRNANDENLDGATLAFTQMAISCVNCHRELRKN